MYLCRLWKTSFRTRRGPGRRHVHEKKSLVHWNPLVRSVRIPSRAQCPLSDKESSKGNRSMDLTRPKCAEIVQTVKGTFSGAHSFLTVTDEGGTKWSGLVIGWTFIVYGSGWREQYGWATSEGFVFSDLCKSRKAAESILRDVVRDEENRK